MEPDSDRLNINLFLKITFVVLFLLLIGELVYFFYIFPNKKITTTIVPTLTPTPAPEPTKAPIPVPLTTPPTKQEFTGKIIELDLIKDDFTSETNDVKLSFKLQDNNGKEIKQFVFSINKNNITQLKIIDLSGKTIPYKNLKVGDRIKIVEVYNFKEKFYLNSSYEITILNVS